VRAVALVNWLGELDRAPAGIEVRRDLRSADVLVPILVAASLAIVDLAAPAFPGSGAFLVLLVPVIACSVVLGTQRGIVAMALCAGGAITLVPLRGHPWLSDPADIARLALYIVVAAGAIVAIDRIPRERHVTASAASSRVDPLPTAVRTPGRAASETGPVETLTLRELDVLRLVAQGRSTQEIADRLYVSRNTVKSHLSHAYGKLGAHNRAQAIAVGLSEGLIDAQTLCSQE